MSEHIHLDIGGMSCIHCQTKIEEALNETAGVLKASVSYKKGVADIEYDAEKVTKKKLISVIESLDYKVLAEGEKKTPDIMDTISLLAVILALYYILQSFGILNLLVPNSLADTGMSLGMLFVIGLLTSVHCIAMCGGIGLSQSLSKQVTPKSKKSKGFATYKPALLYNLGRVCSYTIIGFVLGFIGMIIGGGTTVGISPVFQGLVKIVAGICLSIMGINMLGIFPWLKALTLHTPVSIGKFIGNKAKPNSAFTVGLLNGLMPCGPLQSMWIVALASGNPLTGALSMFMFSLGTVPLMLGMGSIVSFLGKKFTAQVMKIGAVLIVVMGLSMLSQGVALSRILSQELLFSLIIAIFAVGVALSFSRRIMWMRYALYAISMVVVAGTYAFGNVSLRDAKTAGGLNRQTNIIETNRESVSETNQQQKSSAGGASGTKTETGTEIEIEDGVQIVNSTLSRGRYPEITVQAGIPVRWTINAPEGTVNGCNYRMIIQEYGIEHSFEIGDNVIEFTPTESGVVPYSCWMGMVYGSINVVDGAGDISTGNTENNVAADAPALYSALNYDSIDGASCCGF